MRLPVAAIRTYPHYKAPSLATWGFSAASGLALFGSDIPLVREDVFGRLPLVGKYFPVKTEKHEED
ncbi:hypothetical protein BD770DRAFT_442192 [Pilaira anomala]|nr:hypothetical protein BD770DRAFT_442192 [Pilaira anomala]